GGGGMAFKVSHVCADPRSTSKQQRYLRRSELARAGHVLGDRRHQEQSRRNSTMTDLIARTLNRLGRQLRGRLSLPGDRHYADATAIWAKPAAGLPRAVAHCRTAAEVQLAIRAARDCDLSLSVRGGGHDWAGRALCEGIVIDLSGMRNV